MQVVLVMFRSDGERRSFSVVRNMTVIGRREDCDLRIPVGDVSRKHCRLVRTDDGIRIEDLGSSNGTYVNGQRIQEAELSAGDQLSVGPVQFTVQIDGVPEDDQIVAPGAITDPEATGYAAAVPTLSEEPMEGVPADVVSTDEGDAEEGTGDVGIGDELSAGEFAAEELSADELSIDEVPLEEVPLEEHAAADEISFDTEADELVAEDDLIPETEPAAGNAGAGLLAGEAPAALDDSAAGYATEEPAAPTAAHTPDDELEVPELGTAGDRSGELNEVDLEDSGLHTAGAAGLEPAAPGHPAPGHEVPGHEAPVAHSSENAANEGDWDFVVEEAEGERSHVDFDIDIDSSHQQPHG